MRQMRMRWSVNRRKNMYKICWKSKITGATGCGEPVFTTEKSAQDTADDFNRQYPYLEYWVEYVEVNQEITT